MTTEHVCRDCAEPITQDDAPTVLDDPGLCDRCSAEAAPSPDTRAAARRRTRWIVGAVGLAGATVALIGVTIARKRGGADRAWVGHDYRYGDDADDDLDDDLDDEFDDFGDFGGSCEDCDDEAWIHYCPECHRVDD